ncbi:hypothetical protein KY290_005414 [Solanum tuberosum]|uniref:TF-B3 domain-containing protein n=1 Tax=Solanum tuberosum TaxID=4113 RepID=A0ABQ7WE29_SOLTU|nr:hypothetical protein KY289_005809 [Solanum tuberosum]KAH0778987.1 hypothetical protein KY290_005414 [Solanum tuberosum]
MEAYNDECKKHYLLINGKRVISFFKVMIAETFLEVLFFPPKFARSVPHLTDQEIYLEDSCGRRWMATVCNYNGSLAIRQGWDKFSTEHDLKAGEFLLFHYVPDDRHFIVQIFGTSGCEKINFGSNIGKGKQNERTYQETTTPLLDLKEASQSVSSSPTLFLKLKEEKQGFEGPILHSVCISGFDYQGSDASPSARG